MEERSDRFTAIEDLFVDESDQPEYIGVKMGFLGTSSTLIPWGVVGNINDEGRSIETSVDKDTAKNGPAFNDDREITPDFENQVYSYYGLQSASGSEGSGSYGSYYSEQSTEAGTVGPGMSMGDTESGEFREHAGTDEGVKQSQGDDLADEDELRVQR